MQRATKRVERTLDEDVRLQDIEMYIETCVHLPEGSRSALWLLAWTERDRHERPATVRHGLALRCLQGAGGIHAGRSDRPNPLPNADLRSRPSALLAWPV